MHHAPAPKRIAGCSLQARRKLSAWRVAAPASAQPFQQLQTQRQASVLIRQPLNKGLRTCQETPPTTTKQRVRGTFQPENNRKKSNTYYKLDHQSTHSYTTYGNTRGTEKGKIAETLSYPDIFCHNTT